MQISDHHCLGHYRCRNATPVTPVRCDPSTNDTGPQQSWGSSADPKLCCPVCKEGSQRGDVGDLWVEEQIDFGIGVEVVDHRSEDLCVEAQVDFCTYWAHAQHGPCVSAGQRLAKSPSESVGRNTHRGYMREALTGVSAGQGPSRGTGWQVKDSNLRSFRDGFTVRFHWPLGQPAWCVWKDSKRRAQRNRKSGDRPHHAPAARRQPHGRNATMADSSFDIVSKYRQAGDRQRRQQRRARRSPTRYDFKNVGASVELRGEVIKMKANTEERVQGRARRRPDPPRQAQGQPQAPRRPRGRPAPLRQGVPPRLRPSRRASRRRTRRRSTSSSATRAPRASRARSRATSCASRASRATTSRPSSACCRQADLDVALNFTNYR